MTKPTAVLTPSMSRVLAEYLRIFLPGVQNRKIEQCAVAGIVATDIIAGLLALANDQAQVAVKCETCGGKGYFGSRKVQDSECADCHNGWRVVSEGEGK